MKIQRAIFAAIVGLAIVGLAMAGASAASAQVGENARFAACPALDTLETLGVVPDGTMFPCVAIGTFSSDTTASDRAAIVASTGAVTRFDLSIVNGTALLVPNARALWNLAGDPNLIELYPDRAVGIECHKDRHRCDDGGGDTGGGGSDNVPSGVARIGADQVWDSVTGAGVNVAIVDTGLDFNHGDLNPDANCYVNSEIGTSCQDDNGHGTHVAGIVAALRGNDLDVVGVAPDATLHAVKVLDSSGWGLDSWVVAGLQWVLDDGTIGVVNMSLGAKLSELDEDPKPATCDESVYGPVFSAMETAGIVVVVSAGNDRNDDVENRAPAGCSKVITVASTTAEDGSQRSSCGVKRDTASAFTTDGDGVEISAPGSKKEDWRSCGSGKLTGILSLALGGGTTKMSGTSMSAPHVTGVAALVIQQGTAVDIAAAIAGGAFGFGVTPIDHPVFGDVGDNDNIMEGILCAPGALGLGEC